MTVMLIQHNESEVNSSLSLLICKTNLNYMQTQSSLKDVRQSFMNWYQKKFKKKLPIYVRNDDKKKLVKQFEDDTNIIYNNCKA